MGFPVGNNTWPVKEMTRKTSAAQGRVQHQQTNIQKDATQMAAKKAPTVTIIKQGAEGSPSTAKTSHKGKAMKAIDTKNSRNPRIDRYGLGAMTPFSIKFSSSMLFPSCIYFCSINRFLKS
mmetsp:Transcript_18803/g.29357  ORF Transcript_18803/g.29357 Transcript_18803/m.29357 type:complete len:121 (-) Transcript_18803:5-367(-)